MRTIVWWGVWGLVVSAGLVGLLENTPHHVHLLLAVPILTGAVAAAIVRLEYEYHHAVQHAKWLVISSLFLMCGLGYLYAKANAYGPFATATAYKAFLGTTFEMSVPETERALGRRLSEEQEQNKPLQERAQDWLLEALPLPGGHPSESSLTMPLTLFHVPCKTVFLFKKGKLGRVEVDFDPLSTEAAAELMGRLREELEKDYKPAEETDKKKKRLPRVFQKEATEASMKMIPVDPHHSRMRVTVQYLPFLDAPPPALTVEANAF